MAVGDVFSDLQSIAGGEYLDIQPPADTEVVIHNIYHEAGAELYFYDGTNSLKFDEDSAGGIWAGFFFHCTNSKRIRVKNTDTIARLIGYDGVVTK